MVGAQCYLSPTESIHPPDTPQVANTKSCVSLLSPPKWSQNIQVLGLLMWKCITEYNTAMVVLYCNIAPENFVVKKEGWKEHKSGASGESMEPCFPCSATELTYCSKCFELKKIERKSQWTQKQDGYCASASSWAWTPARRKVGEKMAIRPERDQ